MIISLLLVCLFVAASIAAVRSLLDTAMRARLSYQRLRKESGAAPQEDIVSVRPATTRRRLHSQAIAYPFRAAA